MNPPMSQTTLKPCSQRQKFSHQKTQILGSSVWKMEKLRTLKVTRQKSQKLEALSLSLASTRFSIKQSRKGSLNLGLKASLSLFSKMGIQTTSLIIIQLLLALSQPRYMVLFWTIISAYGLKVKVSGLKAKLVLEGNTQQQTSLLHLG